MWKTATENRSRYSLLLLLLLIISSPVLVLCRDVDVAQQRLVSNNLQDVLLSRRMGHFGDGANLPSGLYRHLETLFTFPTAVTTDENVNKQCIDDSLFYFNDILHKGSDWAITMLESSGQLPAGIIGDGSYHAEGLFDECQTARSDPYRFRGKFCTVFFKLAPIGESEIISRDSTVEDHESSSSVLFILGRIFGMSLDSTTRIKPKIAKSDIYTSILNYPSLSLCLPSTCSSSDLGHSIAQMVGSYVIGNQSIVTIADDNLCFTDDQPSSPVDGPVITYLITMAAIAVLIASATIHEIWRNYYGVSFSKADSTAVSALHCFSLITNGRKLLSFKPDIPGPDNLSCLSGIRFLSACSVIFFHSILKLSAAGKGSIVNTTTFEKMTQSWMFLIFTNSTVSVDTFLVISGMLVSFNLFRELDRTGGKLNLKRYYIQRYLRLTPIYGMMIFVVATVSVYLGTGPWWYIVDLGSKVCRKNWWTHLLYINNLFQFDVNDSCMGDSWYLAADMQLFIVAPIFVYSLWRWRKAGLVLLGSFVVASLATKATILTIYDLPPTMIHTNKGELFQDFTNYMDLVYVKPWTRAPPYLIGILTGLFLHRMKNVKLQMPMKSVLFLWTLSIAILLSVIFGFNPSVYEKSVPMIDWIVRLIYSSLHRTAWALAIAWIIIACIHGYGGFVNRFLSWEGFLPLSRLTYCVYLYQFNHIHISFAFSDRLFYFSEMNYLTNVFGFMIVIFAIAFMMALCVEIPFTDLTKLVFASNTKTGSHTGLLETEKEKPNDVTTISQKAIEETMRNNLAKRKTA